MKLSTRLDYKRFHCLIITKRSCGSRAVSLSQYSLFLFIYYVHLFSNQFKPMVFPQSVSQRLTGLMIFQFIFKSTWSFSSFDLYRKIIMRYYISRAFIYGGHYLFLNTNQNTYNIYVFSLEPIQLFSKLSQCLFVKTRILLLNMRPFAFLFNGSVC